MNTKAIQQFNSYMRTGQNKSQIRKALTSAAGVGGALVPEKLEEIITNTIVRLSPELAVLKARFDNQKTHEFNRVTSLPAAGGAMGEAATTPERNSTFVRDTVQLKVIRRKGAVTNFLQDASASAYDAAAQEMENHLQAHVYDLNTYLNWGNPIADAYSFGGLDYFIATNRILESVGGAVPTDLSFLDDMIDRNLEAQGEGHPRVFMMSPRMLSKVSRLLSNVRLNQGLIGDSLSVVNIGGGWRLNAYRDIPIISTTGLRPQVVMGTVGTAAAGAGSGLTDDTWYFRVAPVTYNGEEIASAEVNQATSSNDTLTLSWTAVTGALYYKIYAGTVSGTLVLVRVASAFTYDSAGTITGAVTGYVFSTDPDTADTSAPIHMQADVPYTNGIAAPEETVILWDLHEQQGMGKGPYTNTQGSRFNGIVTMEELARTDDWLPFLVKSYMALCPSFERSSILHRGLRAA